MSFVITYRNLFSVNISHGYYLGVKDNLHTGTNSTLEGDSETDFLERMYNVGDFLLIVPSDTTKRLINQFKLVFKLSRTGFFVGIRTVFENNGMGGVKPFIPIIKPISLTFLIYPKRNNFYNLTTLPKDIGTKKIFHFHNLQNNSIIEQQDTGNEESRISVNYLSAPLPLFLPNTSYELGDWVVDNIEMPSRVFEAITDVEIEDMNPFEAEEDQLNVWQEIESRQYVSRNDLTDIHSGRIMLDLIDLNVSMIRINISDLSGNKVFLETFEVEAPVAFIDNIQIDTDGLAAGKYVLESVDDRGNPDNRIRKEFVILSVRERMNLLGMIEIVVSPENESNSYAIFNSENGTLIDDVPEYTLWWKNRSAKWRYIFNELQRLPENGDTTEILELENPTDNASTVVRSRRHLSLSLIPRNIKFNPSALSSNTDSEIVLPSPAGENLAKSNVDFGEGDVREVFVSNIFSEF